MNINEFLNTIITATFEGMKSEIIALIHAEIEILKAHDLLLDKSGVQDVAQTVAYDVVNAQGSLINENAVRGIISEVIDSKLDDIASEVTVTGAFERAVGEAVDSAISDALEDALEGARITLK